MQWLSVRPFPPEEEKDKTYNRLEDPDHSPFFISKASVSFHRVQYAQIGGKKAANNSFPSMKNANRVREDQIVDPHKLLVQPSTIKRPALRRQKELAPVLSFFSYSDL